MAGRDEGMVTVALRLARTGDFGAVLASGGDGAKVAALRRSYPTDRAVGAEDWIRRLEALTESTLTAG